MKEKDDKLLLCVMITKVKGTQLCTNKCHKMTTRNLALNRISSVRQKVMTLEVNITEIMMKS